MIVLVTGGNGFLGKHVCKQLSLRGHRVISPRRSELDLERARRDYIFKYTENVDAVIHLAATCGGILFNQHRGPEMIASNVRMGINLIEAIKPGQKVVYIGTTCEYPSDTRVPFLEDNLWKGFPEKTNAPYGLAKRLVGEYLIQRTIRDKIDGRYLILANLYGPGDTVGEEKSHVIPALIDLIYTSKIHGDDVISIGCTGNATRDFLYVEDAAKAICDAVGISKWPYETLPVNIGTGIQVSIRDIAHTIADLLHYDGRIEFNPGRVPEGQAVRCLDTTRAKSIGMEASTDIHSGLAMTIEWQVNG